ncbi:MAG: hypothetical protein HOO89_01030 [Ferruginibacter sp.]|nr:hypothetical protein [Ferruginibacter sp.]
MKNKIALIVLFALVSIQVVNAQFLIKIKPTAPRVIRVIAPSRQHVWVDEDWIWQNNTYISRGGYWAAPPHHNSIWKQGHWKNARRGWIWIPGHWK